MWDGEGPKVGGNDLRGALGFPESWRDQPGYSFVDGRLRSVRLAWVTTSRKGVNERAQWVSACGHTLEAMSLKWIK